MDIDHNNEKPIIFVVVTFFLALTLVYIAFFRTKWTYTTTISDDTITSIEANTTGDIASTDPRTVRVAQWLLSGMFEQFTTLSQINQDRPSLPNTNNETTPTNNEPLLWSRQERISTATPVLEPRYGSLKVAPIIWLSTQATYIDNTSGTGSIIYAYLGTGDLGTLPESVRRLWWNVLAIETQNDILKNALRWDRVLFINIPNVTFVRVPTEERVHVAMIVYIGSDIRLIESPIGRYHSSKAIMKSLFEHLYQTVL